MLKAQGSGSELWLRLKNHTILLCKLACSVWARFSWETYSVGIDLPKEHMPNLSSGFASASHPLKTCPNTPKSPVYQQTSCCENWQVQRKVDTLPRLEFASGLFTNVAHGSYSRFLIKSSPSINGFVQVVPNVSLN